MFYGIEKSTDQRIGYTKIIKFKSLKNALKWKSNGGQYTFPDAATSDIPVYQQNWHHSFRSIYKSKPNWKPPKKCLQSVLINLIIRNSEEII